MMFSLDQINAASAEEAARLLEPLIENSPELVSVAQRQRPFATVSDLEAALVGTILSLPPEQQAALFRRHPCLAGREARDGTMTDASTSEQGRLGLDRLAADDLARLDGLNASYAQRFGHPCIVALVNVPDLDNLFETFERRLQAEPPAEHAENLTQIAEVIRARIAKAIGTPDGPVSLSPKPAQVTEKTMENDT
ncbi:2-oxo-4-hydroxy-4-carboxy-5-ureidoimidazoline decarboxylase [Fluviibacterium sp. DFM31]|uniref:2-oxo-4-hydroxy-4-carboxy-5-ureidoimidazoline decarboxylase n=1 Tax=Meridianimarinicoccus marinus TaxID=3231483 RepID=A0ABV3L9E8_9RHOB